MVADRQQEKYIGEDHKLDGEMRSRNSEAKEGLLAAVYKNIIVK